MIKNTEFDKAKKYLEDPNFTIPKFIEFLKSISRMDMCTYLLMFTQLLHKDNFFLDLAIFQVTGKSGQRPQDVQENKKHLLIEYIEAAKKEDIEFMEYSLSSFMPIRYYFSEIKEFAKYFNSLVDELDIDLNQKKRKKFMLRELKDI